MYVPFEEMSEEARVWVYQANRPFKEDEKDLDYFQISQFL